MRNATVRTAGALVVALGTIIASSALVPAHAQNPKARKAERAAPAAAEKHNLTHVGYGPFRVDMSAQQAERVIGKKFERANGRPVNGLHTLDGKFKGVTLYFEAGRLHFIELGESGQSCELGVAVGDSVATLVRCVKSLELNSSRYDEECRDAYAKPHYPECYDSIGMHLRPEFKDKTMRFFLDPKGKVAWIRAGVKLSVQYDEIHPED